jgi:hypothetical protein
MAKLTYWIAKRTNDSNCYSLRAKTKKECQEQIDKAIADGLDKDDFDAPKKVSIEYRDAFDLMLECSTEGRGWWE